METRRRVSAGCGWRGHFVDKSWRWRRREILTKRSSLKHTPYNVWEGLPSGVERSDHDTGSLCSFHTISKDIQYNIMVRRKITSAAC